MVAAPDWLGNTLFGLRKVFSNGVEVVDSNELDFLQPLIATLNPATGRIEVTPELFPTVNTLGGETVPLLPSPILVPEGKIVVVQAVVTGRVYQGTQIAPYVQSILGVYSTAGGISLTEEAGLTTVAALVDSPPFGGSTPMVNVTGAADNGGGKVRLTTNTVGMSGSPTVLIAGVGGTVEANGVRQGSVVDSTHLDLPNVPFVHAYSASSGTILTYGSAGLMLSSGQVQITATGLVSSAYANNDVVAGLTLRLANGNTYIVRRGATNTTSASGTGPSGTGTNIADGSARFDFLGVGPGVPVTWRVKTSVSVT